MDLSNTFKTLYFSQRSKNWFLKYQLRQKPRTIRLNLNMSFTPRKLKWQIGSKNVIRYFEKFVHKNWNRQGVRGIISYLYNVYKLLTTQWIYSTKKKKKSILFLSCDFFSPSVKWRRPSTSYPNSIWDTSRPMTPIKAKIMREDSPANTRRPPSMTSQRVSKKRRILQLVPSKWK